MLGFVGSHNCTGRYSPNILAHRCTLSRPNLHICSILKGWFGPVCGVWGVRTPLSRINITHWPHLTFARCQYMRKMLVEMFRMVMIIADLIEMT